MANAASGRTATTAPRRADRSGRQYRDPDVRGREHGRGAPSSIAVTAVPGGAGLPTDAVFDDGKDNGRVDLADVVRHFNQP